MGFLKSKTGFLSSKCKKKFSEIAGIGIFATKNIKKGEIVAIWGGKVFLISDIKKQFARNKKRIETSEIQITDKHCIVTETTEDCDRINHSCNPNTQIAGQIVLVARKKISPGDEITFDYETAEITRHTGLPFKCNCQKRNCRKIIDGNAWKWAYKKKPEILSWHLQKKLVVTNQ